jgi:hypothetical protein
LYVASSSSFMYTKSIYRNHAPTLSWKCQKKYADKRCRQAARDAVCSSSRFRRIGLFVASVVCVQGC